MIYRNAQRILRLINQLMDIRKLDKGQMFMKFRETDMVGFIDDVSAYLRLYGAEEEDTFQLRARYAAVEGMGGYE